MCAASVHGSKMHASLQSFPRSLPVRFQRHELIGYLGGALGLRQRVGRLTLVDISTDRCGFHSVSQEGCCYSKRNEHEPPSQWNDESKGGRTAKATDALGTLPYAHLMQRSRDRLRFLTPADISHLNQPPNSCLIFWNKKCIQSL